jgi:hypothetical protein
VVSVGYSTNKLKASSTSERNDDALVKLSVGRKTQRRVIQRTSPSNIGTNLILFQRLVTLVSDAICLFACLFCFYLSWFSS